MCHEVLFAYDLYMVHNMHRNTGLSKYAIIIIGGDDYDDDMI
jgi:hypothetical protein